MRGDRVFRSFSPAIRLGLYKNRLVFAVWLLIGAGVLTAPEPFLRVYDRMGVALGLRAPGFAGNFLGYETGSVGHVLAAAACGALLVVLGIAAARRSVAAASAGAVLLAADMALVLLAADWVRMSADALFPLIATFIVRCIFVRFIARGAYAISLRAKLAGRMHDAEREYEEELKARAARLPAGKRFAGAHRNAEEEQYQG